MKTIRIEEPFVLESGLHLDELTIGYHTYGQPNNEKDNVVWVFHALTANSDVFDWWQGLFGVNDLFNPEDHYIICANVIGSPYGSSQPKDLNFPHFSVRDIVRVHYKLAEQLAINKIYVAVGGSFGGNQALEFAYNFHGQIEHLILIASSAKESAWSIAVHETQRMAMKSDTSFGQPNGGKEGMAAARAIGMLTYRTSNAFIESQTDIEDKLDNFKASSYINYQGEKFIKRFNPLSYYYLTKCLDTHNLGRHRVSVTRALSRIQASCLVIGIKTDLLIPVTLQQEMANFLPSCTLKIIDSDFGHDGFLVETIKISAIIKDYLHLPKTKRAVLKFGGSSLKNGEALERSLKLIASEAKKNSIALIVSARAKTTDLLEQAFLRASKGKNYEVLIKEIIDYQLAVPERIDLEKIRDEILEICKAISILGIDNTEVKDRVLAYGELMSALVITTQLNHKGLKAVFVDARKLIVTYWKKNEQHVNHELSRIQTKDRFSKIAADVIPVVTGYIAQNAHGKTTTLGRNGSNYTATLIAKYIAACEIQNWTDVDGIFSANPKFVKDAIPIRHLSYKQANDLANIGASVLHSKTILPLMDSNIPLIIRNSYSSRSEGTKIDQHGSGSGIKAVSLIENVSLISIDGFGLSGEIGIDARLFNALSQKNISVRLISQAATEGGIGFIINKEDTIVALTSLKEAFHDELNTGVISNISANQKVAIIAITGRHNFALEKAIAGLRKNKIWIYVFSNSINGENISLVIDAKSAIKGLKIVHHYVIEN